MVDHSAKQVFKSFGLLQRWRQSFSQCWRCIHSKNDFKKYLIQGKYPLQNFIKILIIIHTGLEVKKSKKKSNQKSEGIGWKLWPSESWEYVRNSQKNPSEREISISNSWKSPLKIQKMPFMRQKWTFKPWNEANFYRIHGNIYHTFPKFEKKFFWKK